jgi:SHS2 domain-containing protein
MCYRPYRIIEHTADTGFEVRAYTMKRVFEAAALAFFDIMWRIGKKENILPKSIQISGGDRYELLVNFLEEFLYLYDAKNLICTHLEIISASDTNINARVWLQQFNAESDQELLNVKAVTYHQLFIGKKDQEWLAQIFVDI